MSMLGAVAGRICRWHGHICLVIVKPVFKKGIKRNALIELLDDDKTRIVVSWRALRRL